MACAATVLTVSNKDDMDFPKIWKQYVATLLSGLILSYYVKQ